MVPRNMDETLSVDVINQGQRVVLRLHDALSGIHVCFRLHVCWPLRWPVPPKQLLMFVAICHCQDPLQTSAASYDGIRIGGSRYPVSHWTVHIYLLPRGLDHRSFSCQISRLRVKRLPNADRLTRFYACYARPANPRRNAVP